MLNRWEGIGRLGREVEIKHGPSGAAIALFSVACSEKWKDKSGEQKEKTEWVRCVAFDKLAEICGKYLTKGMLVFVAGKLSTREWEKDGEKRYTTEIMLSDMKMLSGKQESYDSSHGAKSTSQSRQQTPDLEDDIPF